MRFVSRVAQRARSEGNMRARAASSGERLAALALALAAAGVAAEAEVEAETAAPEAVLEDADEDEADVGEGAGEVAGAGGGTKALGTNAPSSHTMPRHGISDRSVDAQSLASVSRLATTRSHLGTRGPSGNCKRGKEQQRKRASKQYIEKLMRVRKRDAHNMST